MTVRSIISLLVCSSLLTNFAAAQTGTAHVDHEGVPLPAEAVAQVGSAHMRVDGTVRALAHAAGGKHLIGIGVTAVKGALYRWDAATGKLAYRVSLGLDYNDGVAVVDGKIVHLLTKGEYRVLDAATGKDRRRVQIAKAADASINAVAPDASMLAIGNFTDTIRLLDPASGAERLKVEVDAPRRMAFAPGGKTLAVACADSVVHLIDTATGRTQRTLQTPLPIFLLLQFSPDGTRLLTSGRSVGDQPPDPVICWDVVSGKEVWRTRREEPYEHLVAAGFTPDGAQVAIGGNSEYVAIHEVATGKEVRRLRPCSICRSLAYSPDGKTLVAGDGYGTVIQWEVATGKLLPASAQRRCG